MTMTGFLDTLQEKVKALGSSWTAYTAVGSFVLYVFGYLATRFHLTALGVGTDLAVLDERYIFTGARFLVYLVSAMLNVVLIALILSGLGYLFYRLLPMGVRSRIFSWWQRCQSRYELLSIVGIIVSVLMIQLVMKKCFFFNNLLVAQNLPDPAWLARLLFNEERMLHYFSGLVAGTAVPAAVLLALRKAPTATGRLLFLKRLLAFLVVVQFLFLPVNYGSLIVDKALPRVSNLGGVTPLAVGEEAWLAWEGKEGVTYLVRNKYGYSRSLVTLPRSEVKKTEIIRYDAIFPLLFDP
jgi:hypothetical protein